MTTIAAVVGRDAFWQRDKPSDPKKLGAQALGTAILVEVAGSGIKWTEPRDFSLDELRPDGTSSGVTLLSSALPIGGTFFRRHAIGPGSYVQLLEWRRCQFVPVATAPPNKLKGWLSVGGFNAPDIDALQHGDRGAIAWTNLAALAIWIASVGLLLYRARRSRKKSTEVIGDSTGGC